MAPVTGIRASLKESLDVKRDSQTVVDVITSEAVGKFPDKNIAEALQRVSHVSISREYDEGERVSIRDTGLNAKTATGANAGGRLRRHAGRGPQGPPEARGMGMQAASRLVMA